MRYHYPISRASYDATTTQCRLPFTHNLNRHTLHLLLHCQSMIRNIFCVIIKNIYIEYYEDMT